MNTHTTNPSGAVPAFLARPALEAAQVLRPYGVGIDTHSRFIAVCVLNNLHGAVHRTEREFDTSWGSLLAARAWTAGERVDRQGPALPGEPRHRGRASAGRPGGHRANAAARRARRGTAAIRGRLQAACK